MANVFTFQTLKDTTESAIIKLTGIFDGSGDEDNAARIQVNTLYGALDANGVPLYTSASVSNTALSFYEVSILNNMYDCNFGQGIGHLELYWSSNNPANNYTAFALFGQNELLGQNLGNVSVRNNNPNADRNGNIGVKTVGMVAGGSYTLILELRKFNEYFQRGQFNDPAAFNFGPYGIKP